MPSDQVQVTVESRGEWTVVRIVGVLDAASLTAVSKALTDAQRDSAPVYVDLEDVTFMDSRGLGALLAANERSREGAAPVVIYRPSEAVRRLLDVSGVRRVLEEADSFPG
jgi:anti-sigma B factor antagonist